MRIKSDGTGIMFLLYSEFASTCTLASFRRMYSIHPTFLPTAVGQFRLCLQHASTCTLASSRCIYSIHPTFLSTAVGQFGIFRFCLRLNVPPTPYPCLYLYVCAMIDGARFIKFARTPHPCPLVLSTHSARAAPSGSYVHGYVIRLSQI